MTSSTCHITNRERQPIEGGSFSKRSASVIHADARLIPSYSLKDGASFVEQARNATFDLAGDDGIVARTQRASQLTWDRKKKKFVQGDGTGSDNKKLVKTESGARLPASFRSGRFDEWKAKKRMHIPKVGDAEGDHASGQGSTGMNKYRHNNTYDAKPLDAKSTTYEKKVYMQKKKAEKAAEADGAPKGGPKTGYAGQKARPELKDVNAIRRDRKVQEQVSRNSSDLYHGWSPGLTIFLSHYRGVPRMQDPARRAAREQAREQERAARVDDRERRTSGLYPSNVSSSCHYYYAIHSRQHRHQSIISISCCLFVQEILPILAHPLQLD